MNIFPDFYNEFECIGGDCISTCCADWQIEIDKKTADFYQSLDGEFGDYVRKNLIKENAGYRLRMDKNGRCSFLDENGLCQIYKNCGPEHMSHTCKTFPRAVYHAGNSQTLALSLSCEEVLRLLYEKDTPILLCTQGDIDSASSEEVALYQKACFISWCMDVLQSTEIPTGEAMASVAYLGAQAGDFLIAGDYSRMEDALSTLPSVLYEFEQAKKEIPAKELKELAWNLIFNVTDTFCQIVHESNLPFNEEFLWKEEFFSYNDNLRKERLYEAWTNNIHKKSHENFARKLATTFLMGHCLYLGQHTADEIFVKNFCNYIILSEVLPTTWDAEEGTPLYFARLARFHRTFDQSKAIVNLIHPVIEELFAPDILTYAMAFMTIFPYTE